jgi:Domain of unknown function (DUF892)
LSQRRLGHSGAGSSPRAASWPPACTRINDAGVLRDDAGSNIRKSPATALPRAYAETLGYPDAVNLMQQTLEEERIADEKLTRLAERFVNSRAR